MTVRTLGDLALGLAATVLLAAACGGSGGSPFPVSAGPTTSSTQPPRPSPSGGPRTTPSSTASDSALAMSRIPLEGRGPIGLAVVGDTAWVTAPESGDLIAVTL